MKRHILAVSLVSLFLSCGSSPQAPSNLSGLQNPALEDPFAGVEDVEALRTENAKIYQNEDGSYTAAITQYPIHYQKGEGWLDINNTFSEELSREGFDIGVEKAPLKVLFEKSNQSIVKSLFGRGEDNPYRVHVGNDRFQYIWEPSKIGVFDADKNLLYEEKAGSGERSASANRVLIENVFSTAHEEFISEPKSLKHNVILTQKPSVDIDNGTFIYSGKMKIKVPFEVVSGDDSLIPEGEVVEVKAFSIREVKSSNRLFFPETLIFDESAEDPIEGMYRLRKEEDVLHVEVLIDYSWLVSSERVYPVTIDPTTNLSTYYSGYTWGTSSPSKSTSLIKVGTNNSKTTDHYYVGFAEWDVSGIPDGSDVTNVDIKLTTIQYDPGDSNGYTGIRFYGVSNRPATTTNATTLRSDLIDGSYYGYYYFDQGDATGTYTPNDSAKRTLISGDLEDKLGGNWFAVGMRMANSDLDDQMHFYSNSGSEVSQRPTLYATYTAPEVGDAYEPNDTTNQASSISNNNPINNLSIDPANDVDWFKFTTSYVSRVIIETSGSSGDTVLELYKSTNLSSYIAEDDDSGSAYLFSKIDTGIDAGTYYIKVIGFQNNSFVSNYTLSLDVDRDNMRFSSDVTIPDGDDRKAGTSFTKTWNVQNNGQSDWDGYTIHYDGGDGQMSGASPTSVTNTADGNYQNISVNMVAPNKAGLYKSYWQMRNKGSHKFGTRIYVEINVIPNNDPPTLSSPSVSPESGIKQSTNFTYSVVYKDPDGDAPSEAQIHLLNPLGNWSYIDLTSSSGNYQTGRTYVYSTTLNYNGTYKYKFVFNDGTNPDVATSLTSKPVTANPVYKAYITWEEPLDDASVNAGSSFVKKWRLRNDGNVTWTSGTSFYIRYVDGEMSTYRANRNVTSNIGPGGDHTFQVEMVAPAALTNHQENWRFVGPAGDIQICDASGCGYRIWAKIRSTDPCGLEGASIRIISPNGGENWTKGTQKTVTWTSSNLSDKVRLHLYKNGNFVQGISNDLANDGSHTFSFPEVADGSDYKFGMSNVAGAGCDGRVSDYSDNYFTVEGRAPVLSGMDVNPDAGVQEQTQFTWKVLYSDADGNAPTQKTISIWNPIASRWYDFDMVAGSGDYTNGKWYTFTKDLLSIGTYKYKFIFDDGAGHQVTSNEYSGPTTSATPPANYSLIIDDLDAEFTRSGTPSYWQTAGNGYKNHMYYNWNVSSNQDNVGKWQPNLPASGTYSVYVHIPDNHATTKAASYKITHKNGTTTQSVDQSLYYNEWVPLGSYEFNQGSGGYVTLSDLTGEANGSKKIGFDAVKWSNVSVAPVLSSHSVSPGQDIEGTNFTWSVTYTDYDNDAPSAWTLSIRKPDGYWDDYSMNAGSGNYLTGKEYNLSLNLTEVGDYQYRFYFNDGNGHGVTSPTYSGPTVNYANRAPTLTNFDVDPTFGQQSTTNYAWSLTYTDLDGDAPTEATLSIQNPQTGNWYDFAMNAGNGDYASGKNYSYSKVLIGIGNYQYKFKFDDGNGHVVTKGPYNGPNSVAAPEIVVSEQSNGFVKSGPPNYWNSSTSYGLDGQMSYTWNNYSNLENSARWQPNLPAAAQYEVFAYIPSNHATTLAAKYTIRDGNGQEHQVSVEQFNYSDEWVTLGSYYFAAGSNGYVELSDVTGESSATRKIGFDSVKWVAFDGIPNAPPTLTSESVIPSTGEQSKEVFQWEITYADALGEAPVQTTLQIQEPNSTSWKSYSMSPVSGGDFTNGKKYRFLNQLDLTGLYKYRFVFKDSSQNVTTSTTYERPQVTAPIQQTYKAEFISETPVDDKEYHKNREFTKVWQFKNTGSATWDAQVKMKRKQAGPFISQLSLVSAKQASVATGSIATFEVPMKTYDVAIRAYEEWELIDPSGDVISLSGTKNNVDYETAIVQIIEPSEAPTPTNPIDPSGNPSAQDIKDYIYQLANEYQVPPIVIQAIAYQESGWLQRWTEGYSRHYSRPVRGCDPYFEHFVGDVKYGYDVPPDDDASSNFYLSKAEGCKATSVGIGIMQITYKVNPLYGPEPSSGIVFSPKNNGQPKFVNDKKYKAEDVASQWKMNLKAGVDALRNSKFPTMNPTGWGCDSDPRIVENWFYGMGLYNGAASLDGYLKPVYNFIRNGNGFSGVGLHYLPNVASPLDLPGFPQDYFRTKVAPLTRANGYYLLKHLAEDTTKRIHRWKGQDNYEDITDQVKTDQCVYSADGSSPEKEPVKVTGLKLGEVKDKDGVDQKDVYLSWGVQQDLQYDVVWKFDTDAGYTVTPLRVPAPNTVIGLDPNGAQEQKYDIKVRACNSNKCGDYSSEIEVAIAPTNSDSSLPPQVNLDTVVITIDGDKVRIDWDDVSFTDGVQYQVRTRKAGETKYDEEWFAYDESFREISGVKNGEYYFGIRTCTDTWGGEDCTEYTTDRKISLFDSKCSEQLVNNDDSKKRKYLTGTIAKGELKHYCFNVPSGTEVLTLQMGGAGLKGPKGHNADLYLKFSKPLEKTEIPNKDLPDDSNTTLNAHERRINTDKAVGPALYHSLESITIYNPSSGNWYAAVHGTDDMEKMKTSKKEITHTLQLHYHGSSKKGVPSGLILDRNGESVIYSPVVNDDANQNWITCEDKCGNKARWKGVECSGTGLATIDCPAGKRCTDDTYLACISGFHRKGDHSSRDFNLGGGGYDINEFVYAPLSGTVIFSGNAPGGYGHTVLIQSDIDSNFVARLSHMINPSGGEKCIWKDKDGDGETEKICEDNKGAAKITPAVGTYIKAGEKVGLVGKTGTPYYHLHFTLYKNMNLNLMSRQAGTNDAHNNFVQAFTNRDASKNLSSFVGLEDGAAPRDLKWTDADDKKQVDLYYYSAYVSRKPEDFLTRPNPKLVTEKKVSIQLESPLDLAVTDAQGNALGNGLFGTRREEIAGAEQLYLQIGPEEIEVINLSGQPSDYQLYLNGVAEGEFNLSVSAPDSVASHYRNLIYIGQPIHDQMDGRFDFSKLDTEEALLLADGQSTFTPKPNLAENNQAQFVQQPIVESLSVSTLEQGGTLRILGSGFGSLDEQKPGEVELISGSKLYRPFEVTSWKEAELEARLVGLDLEPGSYELRVMIYPSRILSNKLSIDIVSNDAQPKVTGSSQSILVSDSQDWIDVYGESFQEGSTLLVGGQAPLELEQINSRLLRIQLPSKVAGDHGIVVLNPNGKSSIEGLTLSFVDGTADPDGDGLSNAEELAAGLLIDNPDFDGDGVLDGADAFPFDPNESLDSDQDYIGDNEDSDDDNDGIDDVQDNCKLIANEDQVDFDSDNVGDACDDDVDGDGIANLTDQCLSTPLGEGVNSDGCGCSQLTDQIEFRDCFDDKCNGVNWEDYPIDAFDHCQNGEITELICDPIVAYSEVCNPDDDYDLVFDVDDLCPATSSGEVVDDQGCSCSQQTLEERFCSIDKCDGEEWLDYPVSGLDSCFEGTLTLFSCEEFVVRTYSSLCDPDDDNDGVLDGDDACPNDPNDPFNDPCNHDEDNDGVLDVNDAFPLDAAESADTDGDGVGDNTEWDADNDGVINESEVYFGTNFQEATSKPVDADGDGVIDIAQGSILGRVKVEVTGEYPLNFAISEMFGPLWWEADQYVNGPEALFDNVRPGIYRVGGCSDIAGNGICPEGGWMTDNQSILWDLAANNVWLTQSQDNGQGNLHLMVTVMPDGRIVDAPALLKHPTEPTVFPGSAGDLFDVYVSSNRPMLGVTSDMSSNPEWWLNPVKGYPAHFKDVSSGLYIVNASYWMPYGEDLAATSSQGAANIRFPLYLNGVEINTAVVNAWCEDCANQVFYLDEVGLVKNISEMPNFDGDEDGILFADDNCPLMANVDQADFDSDGYGDLCDPDDDNDGINDDVDVCPFGENDALGDPCNPNDCADGSEKDNVGHACIHTDCDNGSLPFGDSSLMKICPLNNQYIYESGEKGNTLGWFKDGQPGVDPNNVSVSVVYEDAQYGNVIALQGEGKKNSYFLKTPDGDWWRNSDFKTIRWKMKYNEAVVVTVYVETTEGFLHFNYWPRDGSTTISNSEVTFNIGNWIQDGDWHTITRNLETDLRKVFPEEASVKEVMGIRFVGSGRVDDVALLMQGTKEVSGTILDDTGIPMENVKVLFKPGDVVAKTDANGFYQFEHVTVTQYEVLPELKWHSFEAAQSSEVAGVVTQDFTGSFQNEIIYEDGESTQVSSAWSKKASGGADPADASMTIEDENGSYGKVLSLSGEGKKHIYALRGIDGDWWNNNAHAVIQWDMKYGEDFVVIVHVRTNAGVNSFEYWPREGSSSLQGDKIRANIGNYVDGDWHTITRDLQADLDEIFSDKEVTSIDGISFIGSGRIDNIKTLTKDIYSVSGKVTDDAGDAMEGIELQLMPGNLKASSDANGDYLFAGVVSDQFTLQSGQKWYSIALAAAQINGTQITQDITATFQDILVYEDGESGQVGPEWSIGSGHGADLNDAQITIEDEGGERGMVMNFNGLGKKHHYTLKRANGKWWDDATHKVIQWDMKYARNQDVVVIVFVETTDGVKQLQYWPSNDSWSLSGDSLRMNIGQFIKDGLWHTIARNLDVDLKQLLPDADVLKVRGISFIGSGQADNIILRSAE